MAGLMSQGAMLALLWSHLVRRSTLVFADAAAVGKTQPVAIQSDSAFELMVRPSYALLEPRQHWQPEPTMQPNPLQRPSWPAPGNGPEGLEVRCPRTSNWIKRECDWLDAHAHRWLDYCTSFQRGPPEGWVEKTYAGTCPITHYCDNVKQKDAPGQPKFIVCRPKGLNWDPRNLPDRARVDLYEFLMGMLGSADDWNAMLPSRQSKTGGTVQRGRRSWLGFGGGKKKSLAAFDVEIPAVVDLPEVQVSAILVDHDSETQITRVLKPSADWYAEFGGLKTEQAQRLCSTRLPKSSDFDSNGQLTNYHDDLSLTCSAGGKTLALKKGDTVKFRIPSISEIAGAVFLIYTFWIPLSASLVEGPPHYP